MKRFIIYVVAVMCTIGSSLYAKDYQWLYNLAFEAPEDGRVAYNTRSRLEMVWHDMAYIVQVYRNTGVTDELMKCDLQRKASGYNMYDTRTVKYSNSSFKGFCLEGTLPDGSQACIYNLLSKNTDVFLQVTVNYTINTEKEAKKIVKSLKELKPEKKKPKVKQKIQKKDAPPKPIKKTSTSPAELYEI